ncbi:MAG: IS1595-like element ISCARN94 family transposase, partial [Sulfuricella sp.]
YRFNRRFNLGIILKRLVHATVATAPWPEPAIRMAEACN